MLGAGRPAQSPVILSTRELTQAEVLIVERAKSPAVKKLRDSHHMVARLFAMGLRPGEVAMRSGYGLGRVSVLAADPAFQELVANYRASVDESWKESADEYFETITSTRIIAARLLHDKLSQAEPDDLSIRELVSVHADTADRTGYPKRSVAVNVNVDFAARLDRAIERSQTPKALSQGPSRASNSDGEQQTNQRMIDITPPLKRRAFG